MSGCVCVCVAACDPISYSNLIFSSNHSYTLLLKMMSTHYCLSKEPYCLRNRDSLSLSVYPPSCCPWFCNIPHQEDVSFIYALISFMLSSKEVECLFICVCRRTCLCVRDRESDTDTQEKGFLRITNSVMQ